MHAAMVICGITHISPARFSTILGSVRDENNVLQLAPAVILVEQLRMPCGVCKSKDLNDTLLTGMLNAARLSCFAHCNIKYMWYIVRLDSSRVATLVKVRSATLVSSSDPTRVKSNYIPVETRILRQIEPTQVIIQVCNI